MESLTQFKSNKSMLTTPIKTHQPLGPIIDTPDRVLNTVRSIRKSSIVDSGFGLSRVNGCDLFEESPALFPEKYEMLCQFFDAMVSSIRLLRLKRQSATFSNLSRNIESLTDRRFTLNHLAQLKYVMPEVIVVKETRVLEEKTCCMKEDLLISLDTSAVETDKIEKGSARYPDLKGIFRSRIDTYATALSEDDDVPEGELPELFYLQKPKPDPSMIRSSALQPTLMAPCFIRRFSSRTLSAPVHEPSPVKLLPETPIKVATSAIGIDEYIEATPVKVASVPMKFNSTPAKFASTPARLMSATPALRTPKRSRMGDDVDITMPNKSAKRRALNFDESCDDVQVQMSVASEDLLEVLPENLFRSLMEKESITIEEQDPTVSQARKQQELMSGVSKIFDMIQLLFQSITRSSMTKSELIHKIISGHLDVVDKREVEEQLTLLQEIAPEFITEHSCLSGDTLVRLNKTTCVESIRAKVIKAN